MINKEMTIQQILMTDSGVADILMRGHALPWLRNGFGRKSGAGLFGARHRR